MKTNSQGPEDYSQWYAPCLARELGRIFPDVVMNMCYSYPRIARWRTQYPKVGTPEYYDEWAIVIRWCRSWDRMKGRPELVPIFDEIEKRIQGRGT